MATVQSPRRQPLVQKILIPSGLVKANETVVIEVPSNLKRHAVVVATRPGRSARNRLSDGMGDEAFQRYPCAFTGEAAPAYGKKDKETEHPQDGDYAEDDALLYDVDEAEKMEREILFRNLRAFHRARRNVLQGTKNLLAKTAGGGAVVPPELAAEPVLDEEEDNYYNTYTDDADNEDQYDEYECGQDCPQQPEPQPVIAQRFRQHKQQQQQQQHQHQQQQQQRHQMSYQNYEQYADGYEQ